jgi:hypothetical protein
MRLQSLTAFLGLEQRPLFVKETNLQLGYVFSFSQPLDVLIPLIKTVAALFHAASALRVPFSKPNF